MLGMLRVQTFVVKHNRPELSLAIQAHFSKAELPEATPT
jgi:hypothetical protein